MIVLLYLGGAVHLEWGDDRLLRAGEDEEPPLRPLQQDRAPSLQDDDEISR